MTPQSPFLPANVQIAIQCSVNFTGSQVPTLSWSRLTQSTMSESPQVNSRYSIVESTITTSTLPPPSVIGPYECSVQFPVTTNCPKYSWTSSTTQTSCEFQFVCHIRTCCSLEWHTLINSPQTMRPLNN